MWQNQDVEGCTTETQCPPFEARAQLNGILRAAAADQLDEIAVQHAVRDYCRARRVDGAAPEQVLVEVKGALRDALRDRRPAMVERLVRDCIRQYYRDD